MPCLIFVPSGRKIMVTENKSLLDAAFENLIEIDHNCGGVCACTACLIYVKRGKEYLNKISDGEISHLIEDNKLTPEARLACQCRVMTDEDAEIEIEIPEIKNEKA